MEGEDPTMGLPSRAGRPLSTTETSRMFVIAGLRLAFHVHCLFFLADNFPPCPATAILPPSFLATISLGRHRSRWLSAGCCNSNLASPCFSDSPLPPSFVSVDTQGVLPIRSDIHVVHAVFSYQSNSFPAFPHSAAPPRNLHQPPISLFILPWLREILGFFVFLSSEAFGED